MRRPRTLILSLLAGCAAATPAPETGPPELPPAVITSPTGADIRVAVDERGVVAELPVPPARAWAALTAVYTDLELAIDILDPGTQRIGFERMTRSRVAGRRADSLVRCGNEGAGPSAASRHRITLDGMSSVRAGRDGGSILHTLMTGTATPVDGSSTSRVGCVSEGILEKQIAASVAAKLGLVTGR